MNKEIVKLRLESSMDNLEYLYNSKIINKNIYSTLKTLLNCRMKSLSKNNTLNEMLYLFKNITNEININDNNIKKEKAVIGFSGGIDSTASTVILKNIFNIIGITAYSPIIMNNELKYNINSLIEKLQINHKYINIDIGEIENKVKLGHIHPCGRCHSVIENSIVNYSINNNIKYIIYGDMLSVGPLSIVKTEQNLIRINILSFLAITKNESRELLKNNSITISQKYGCKLLKEAHKFNKNKKFTIQRILREVRAQVITEEEGYKNIMEVINP